MSSYLDLVQGAPQGSNLGPPLFNLFRCSLLLFVEEAHIVGYADHKIPDVYFGNVEVTLDKLEEVRKILFNGLQTIS